jgi:hypothetical protein
LLSVMMELGTLKQKIISWIKLTACLELILARGLASIHLVNLSPVTSRWVKPLGAFLKGPKRSRPHTGNGHVAGMVWTVHLSWEVLAPLVGFHDLSHVTGGRRPVKTLPKSLFNHALMNIEEQHHTFFNGIAPFKDA